MTKILYRTIITLAVMSFFTPALAQVQKVTTVNPSSRAKEAYMDVYDYDYVEYQPQFPGGERALINFINKTREYPYRAYKRRIEGRVLCSFIINTNGAVSNITVIRGAEESLNREAVRVISEMPKWKPGRQNGENVPVKVLLPISFRL